MADDPWAVVSTAPLPSPGAPPGVSAANPSDPWSVVKTEPKEAAAPTKFPYDEPGYYYGNLFPFRIQQDAEGKDVPGTQELAFPEFIRSPARGWQSISARLEGPMTPEKMKTLTPDELSLVMATPGLMDAGAVAAKPIGKAVSGIANISHKIAEPIIDWLSGAKSPEAVKSAAAQEVFKVIAQDTKAGGPTAQDMLDLVDLTPSKPQTLADVGGENTKGLAGRVARAPGESRQISTGALESRDSGAGERLVGDVNKALGREGKYQTEQALMNAQKTGAAPLYDDAYAEPAINSDALQPHGAIGVMLSRPSMKIGIANALKIAAEEGRDPNTMGITFNEAGDPVFTKVPSWQTLDYIKRGLDNVVEQYRDKTTGRLVLDTYGRAAEATREMYRSILKELNPKYAKALASWSGPSSSLDAIHAGEDILLREPEENAARYNALEPGDKEFFKIGAAAKLKKTIAKTGEEGDEARKIVGNSYTQSQLRPMFATRESYDMFIDSVKAESRMFKTKVKALGNSFTAGRLAEDGTPESEAAAHAGAAGMGALRSDPISAIRNIIRSAASLRQRDMPEINAQIAKLLNVPVSQLPPDILDRLKALASDLPPAPQDMIKAPKMPRVLPLAATSSLSRQPFSPSPMSQYTTTP